MEMAIQAVLSSMMLKNAAVLVALKFNTSFYRIKKTQKKRNFLSKYTVNQVFMTQEEKKYTIKCLRMK
jgi:uncharacterized membrane protein